MRSNLEAPAIFRTLCNSMIFFALTLPALAPKSSSFRIRFSDKKAAILRWISTISIIKSQMKGRVRMFLFEFSYGATQISSAKMEFTDNHNQ